MIISKYGKPTMGVMVFDIRRGAVRLGFETADNVPVHRQEVWKQLRVGLMPGRRKGPALPQK